MARRDITVVQNTVIVRVLEMNGERRIELNLVQLGIRRLTLAGRETPGFEALLIDQLEREGKIADQVHNRPSLGPILIRAIRQLEFRPAGDRLGEVAPFVQVDDESFFHDEFGRSQRPVCTDGRTEFTDPNGERIVFRQVAALLQHKRRRSFTH